MKSDLLRLAMLTALAAPDERALDPIPTPWDAPPALRGRVRDTKKKHDQRKRARRRAITKASRRRNRGRS